MTRPSLTVALAGALALTALAAEARPPVGLYSCSGSKGGTILVEVLESGCTVDGEPGAEATSSPLECHMPPPVIRALTLFDDLTYDYDPGNSALNQDGFTETASSTETTGDGTTDTTAPHVMQLGLCSPAG